jgi:hypothetical protein
MRHKFVQSIDVPPVRKCVDGSYVTVREAGTAWVTLEIDIDALSRDLGTRAALNKGKRSTAIGGIIRATVKET